MPICFCVSHGCSSAGGTDPISHKPRGKNVDTRTLKAHSVADRQVALHAAEQNTEATIDTQIKEITAYLSASVLADEVSRPSKSPGGSLWSRHASLADIEVEVGALYNEVLNSLAQLGQPSTSGPPSPFPLADLFLSSKDLNSRLEI